MKKTISKDTLFVPITMHDEPTTGDEYYVVNIQVVKKKNSDMFFSQIMRAERKDMLTIDEILEMCNGENN